MIHVCQIDIGHRYVFDMTQGIDDVLSLKHAIEKQANVSLNDQILLISGGEVLKNLKQKLFGLSAGIEESPIYLIDVKNIKLCSQKQQLLQQQQLMQLQNFLDMSKEIDDAINLLEPTYQTVLLRTQLANKIYENDYNLNKLCEQYYMDQYWQYQGFMALIANLDDLITSIEKLFERTKEQFLNYNQNKINNLNHLNEIEKYIKILSDINLIPELNEFAANNLTLFQSICSQSNINNSINHVISSSSTSSIITTNEQQQQQQKFQQQPITSSPSSVISSSSFNNLTSPNSTQLGLNIDSSILSTTTTTKINLLDWTNLTDPRHKLETVLLKAKESFDYLDINWWTLIENEFKLLINEGNNKQMKEIEGLTKRLSDLNNLLESCKNCLSRQKEISDSFKTNLSRATTLKDESILQDLCIGHEGTLTLLSQNHVKIVDITKRVCKAKFELTKVINSRLNWVMNVQTQLISNLNTKLIVCNEKIKQSNLHMKQVEQIKNAPNIYFQALNETQRREKFSRLYKELSKEIYNIINDLTKNELKRREKFSQKFSRNYIANLFPYLNDQLQTFLKLDLNLNYDLNIPKFNDLNLNEIKNEFKLKHFDYKFDDNYVDDDCNDIKLIEILIFKFKNEIKKFIHEQILSCVGNDDKNIINECVDDLKCDIDDRNNKNDAVTDTTLPTDTSALFLSKLTDTQIANSDNDEQLILVNKKAAANKEFLDKLNDIYKCEINSLKENLDIMREDFENIKKNYKNDNKLFENLIINLKKELFNEKLKKKKFYKNLIDNLFSNRRDLNDEISKNDIDKDIMDDIKKNENNMIDEDLMLNNLDSDKLDEEFCNDLKNNLLKLRETYDRTVEDTRKTMDLLKINFQADKQKHFNEAIDRVSKEKDKKIDELKQIQEKLNIEIDELKQKLTNNTDQEDAFQRSLMKQHKLNERVQFLEQQLSKYIPQTSSKGSSSSSSNSTSSAVTITQQPHSSEANNLSASPQNQNQIFSNKYQPISIAIQLNSCSIGDLVMIIYDFTYCAYKIVYQRSPYTHFVHTDSIKIFDPNSQIYKEFINSTEQQQLDSITQFQTSQPQPPPPPPQLAPNLDSLPSSPSSPLNLDETFTNLQFNKEAIQNLIGTIIYNQGSNLLSSNLIQPKLETSTTTLTSSMLVNTSLLTQSTTNNNINKPLWFIGRVIHKEFCIARKANNRYKVPTGTQFYRVRVHPFKI